MPNSPKLIFSFLLMITFLVVCEKAIFAQELNFEKMKEILSQDAGFTPEDFPELESGKIVKKIIPPTEKREIAVIGLIKVNAPIKIVEESFNKTILLQRRSSAEKFGQFSENPSIEDVKDLELEEQELENLKNCKINQCDLKLSANMIEKFQTDIDWNSSDQQQQAANLYRKLLLEYLITYREKGNGSLIKYQNKQKEVDLYEEYQELLSSIFWLNEFAPAFTQSIKNYPESDNLNYINTFSWSKIKFGYRPVIILSHTANYDQKLIESRQILILSNQIYSSRYIDSSIGLTAIINFAAENGKLETYVLFANYTRASALDSSFGSFARKIVEMNALEKIDEVLNDTKKNAILIMLNQQQVDESKESNSFFTLLFANNNLLWALLLFIVVSIILVIFLNSRKY